MTIADVISVLSRSEWAGFYNPHTLSGHKESCCLQCSGLFSKGHKAECKYLAAKRFLVSLEDVPAETGHIDVGEMRKRMEVARGGGHQPIETNAPRVPPSGGGTGMSNLNVATASVPWDTGITITTGIPVKPPCEHDFLFLRSEPTYVDFDKVPDTYVQGVPIDVFYCRRCLQYAEVKP